MSLRQRFLNTTNLPQFQITVNITAVLLTFISAVASNTETSVLTAVQLLWVNLIMDTFAALALATDPPTPSILDRDPEPKSAPLITITMWKMIIGQSFYQLAVTLIMYFGGTPIFSYYSDREQLQLPTLIFNTFVWMQIFNQYNNRRLDNKLNVFEGIHRNYFFIVIQFIIVGGQIIIVFFGGRAFSTHRLNRAQWLYSVILGFLSMPVAVIIRLIPDDGIRKCIPKWFRRKAAPKVLVSDEERRFEWNAIEEIKEELTFLKKLRGGRLHNLAYRLQHPSTLLPRSRSGSFRSRSPSNSLPRTPTTGEASGSDTTSHPPRTPESRKSANKRLARSRSNSAFAPATAMAGIVAGSIAGWSPIGRRDEDYWQSLTQADGRSHLENQDEIEIYPASSSRDPIVVEGPKTHNAPPSQVPETTPAPAPSMLAPPPRD